MVSKRNLPTVFVGFDSAWANNPKAPGAICAVEFDGERLHQFHAPRLVDFEAAAALIQTLHCHDRVTIVAIDQPTIVVNASSMRPVDRAAASLISWMGGGVQPANTGKAAFFGASAPIWRFLSKIDAKIDPEAARVATSGVYAIEVFPAIALSSLDVAFFGRLKGPRYNPARRKTFKIADWNAVVGTASAEAYRFGLGELAAWLSTSMPAEKPRKEHQDKLDAAICLLVGLRWRLGPRNDSVMLGDTETGHIVAPASAEVRERLAKAAARISVPLDGAVRQKERSPVS